MIYNQANIFLIFIINGVIIGIIFDFFRIIRRSFKTTELFTYIEDILFWIITGFTLLFTIFTFCNGEIRFYMFIGVFLGCVLYMLLFSRQLIQISLLIINKLKKIITKIILCIIMPFKYIITVIRRIIFRPIITLAINITKKPLFFKKNKGFFKKK